MPNRPTYNDRSSRNGENDQKYVFLLKKKYSLSQNNIYEKIGYNIQVKQGTNVMLYYIFFLPNLNLFPEPFFVIFCTFSLQKKEMYIMIIQTHSALKMWKQCNITDGFKSPDKNTGCKERNTYISKLRLFAHFREHV